MKRIEAKNLLQRIERVNKVRRFLFVTVAAILTLGVALSMATPALADPGPLVYSPSRYPASDYQEVAQGGSVSFTLTITADKGTDVTYDPKLVAVGGWNPIETGWIGFDTSPLTLSAGESKTTTVTISMPTDEIGRAHV